MRHTMLMALVAGLMPLGAFAAPSPTALAAGTVSGTGAASAHAAAPVANPLQVTSISVVISGTTGYARDAALEQAARQALPQVLTGPAFGLPLPSATAKTKTLGSAMPFVARYNIRQERVLPSYSLLVDMTFNEAKLRQNFGGPKVSSPAPEASAAPSGTVAVGAETPGLPQQVWFVAITEPSAAGQDRARRALAALPNTTATLWESTHTGATFKVATRQPESAVQGALAGWNPRMVPHNPAPAAATPQPAFTPAQPSYAEPQTLPAEALPTGPVAPAGPAAPASGDRPSWLPPLW